MKKKITNEEMIPNKKPRREAEGRFNNRYQPLSNHEDTDNSSEDEESVMEVEHEKSEGKEVKPPPIVLHSNYEYKKLLTIAKANTKKGINMKFTRNNTIIYTQNKEDFLAMKNALAKEKETQWHTYTPNEDKTHAFVIYGIVHDPDLAEMKEEIQQHKIKVINLYKMKNTKQQIYVLVTDKYTTLNELKKNVKCIQNVIVEYDKLKNKCDMLQCHRCQAWGHSAMNCYANPKCMKCGGEHFTSSCIIKKNDDNYEEMKKLIQCANCRENHLANSISCPAYIKKYEYMQRNKPKTPERRYAEQWKPAPSPKSNAWRTDQPTIETNSSEEFPPLPATQIPRSQPIGRTKTQEANKEDRNDIFTLMSEMRELNGIINIKTLINLIRELKSKLIAHKNDPLGLTVALFDFYTSIESND